MRIINLIFFLLATGFLFPEGLAAQTENSASSVVGKWNLNVQNNNSTHPAWLEIKRSGYNTLVGSYVGAGGSARPISKIVYSEDNQLYSFSIPPQWEQLDDDIYFEFSFDDEEINGTTTIDGDIRNWIGTRAPELIRNRAPVWGNPINLLDRNMTKWIIPNNNKFQMEDGVLVNQGSGGNLITTEKFDDFKIHLEYRYPEGSNSGVYLRGRYEVQIMDHYGQKPGKSSNSGIYGFIAPSTNAAKRANEWQTMDITLTGRMVTIVLNGVEVINNRAIPGMTGGALDNNEEQAGPIMIQGDHGAIEFRKIVVTPSAN